MKKERAPLRQYIEFLNKNPNILNINSHLLDGFQ